MKPIKLYKVEVGVLLNKKHEDYEDYAKVYDEKHGYYDEISSFFTNKKNALRWLKNYVKNGAVNTYGILSELVYDQDEIGYDDDYTRYMLKEIKESGIFDDWVETFEYDLYDPKNVTFTQYKVANNEYAKIF